MGLTDDKNVDKLEGKDDLRQRKPLTKSQREKRKSEVLIAAKSLDNEVQSVKNLKRISIGSIDLLIDPEMEYRVNVNSSSNNRNSWSSGSSSSGDENDRAALRHTGASRRPEKVKDEADQSFETEYGENSFDETNAEYLGRSEEVLGNHATSFGDGSQNRYDYNAPQASSKRTLSGVGSLRRGSVNASARKHSFTPEAGVADSTGSSLTKNLLWVPANQHPNVRPENYLELVQDTLHNIKLEDRDGNSINEHTDKENYDKFERLPIDFSRQHKSLVRRPSRLRKSYIECEEDDDQLQQEDVDSGIVSQQKPENESSVSHSSVESSRTVSLKDITEELTKMSNNAGLTNSDAITLARTLSMAGSFKTDESSFSISDKKQQSTAPDSEKGTKPLQTEKRKEDDNEFASNMFMKNGFVIPARSSLRRSKFNTYRIRSSGNSPLDEHKPQNQLTHTDEAPYLPHTQNAGLNVGPSKELKMVQANDKHAQNLTHMSHSKNNGDEEYSNTSPSPSNDFQDIYDHYRQSSIDWDKEMNQVDDMEHPSRHDDIKLRDEESEASHASVSQDSSILSTSSSSSSVVKKSEQMQPIASETPALPSTKDLVKQNQKKGGWSLLNSMGNKEIVSVSKKEEERGDIGESHTEVSVSHEHLNKDFLKATNHTRTESERLAAERSNHSKNRHLPIFTAGNVPETKEKSSFGEEDTTSSGQNISSSGFSTVLPDRRQRLEKKFVNLFKRKGKSNASSGNTLKKLGNSELKKKASTDSMPKFRKNLKNATKVRSESRVEEHLRSAAVSREVKIAAPISTDIALPQSDNEKVLEELPALQPAVSVTSAKNNQNLEEAVVESVRELDEDDSQDISGEHSANSTIDISQESISVKKQSLQAFPDGTHESAPSQAVLPPRKLVFGDVKRPDRPNASIQFTDSAFGFPLPMLTVSTVIMFDHRLPINVERAIYRLSHLKLSDPKRALRQQVILSNFMYAYLNLVNHTLYMEQAAQDPLTENEPAKDDSALMANSRYTTEHNAANGAICIPDI